MRYTILLTLITLISAGCGDQNMTPNYQDPALKPYLANFVSEGQKRGRDLSQQADTLGLIVGGFDPKSNGRIISAKCDTLENGQKQVSVNQELWEAVDEQQKEQILFHEFGHCLMNREHLNTRANNNPTSLMTSNVLTINSYYDNRTAYLDEMFK